MPAGGRHPRCPPSVRRDGAAGADAGRTARPRGLGPGRPGPLWPEPTCDLPRGSSAPPDRPAVRRRGGTRRLCSGESRPVSAPSPGPRGPGSPSGDPPALGRGCGQCRGRRAGSERKHRVSSPPSPRPLPRGSRQRGERPNPGTPRGSPCRGCPRSRPGELLQAGGYPRDGLKAAPPELDSSPPGWPSAARDRRLLPLGGAGSNGAICTWGTGLLPAFTPAARPPGRLGGERRASPPVAAGPRSPATG